MGVLQNPQHERFCQELNKLICAGGNVRESRSAAYQAAGYETKAEYLPDNARKLANRPDVKGRLAELRTRSATLAEIDAGWCLLVLKRRVERADRYNIDDYLTPAMEGAPRYPDIARASREELGRLSELTLEEEIIDAGEDTMRRVRKTKFKGYVDVEAAVGLIAKINGYLAPTRVAPTNPAGDGPATFLVRWQDPVDAPNPPTAPPQAVSAAP